MNLAESIRYHRMKMGLYQADLGRALGVTAQAISKWEMGKAEPDSENLMKLCEMFEISVDELLGRRTAQEQASMDGLMLDEKRIIDQYRRLTDEGKAKAFEYLLLLQHQYRRDDDAQT